MKFSYQWLKEYVEKIPEPRELAEILTMRIFEVEGVKKINDDFMLDIKILPNRAADCFSHLGVAREIAAIAGVKYKEPAFKVDENKDKKVGDYLAVEVKEKKLCPRYSARVILGLKVGESPDWLKKRLATCGLRPINNIVDITNFVMLETGQPLHAFDFDKIECENPKFHPPTGGPISKQIPNPNFQKKKIIVRRARKGEKIITLDEGRAERELNENILVIADEEKPIAIAGIKGGRGTEIEDNTQNIIIEAANFEAVNIRKNSKALNLRTDASTRFENRPDINLTLLALDRCAALVAEIAGGQTAAGVIDEAAIAVKTWNAGVAHEYIERLLGVKIDSAAVADIFKRLDLPCKIIKKGEEVFYEALVPTRRPDLQTQEDLIEEIGRFYGYENIKPVLPSGSMVLALKDERLIYADKIRDMMQGFGYSETYNYSFIGEEDKDFFDLGDLAEVINPFSRDQKYLRSNLAIGFIKNIRENRTYLAGSRFVNLLRLFEIGNVFSLSGDKIMETKKLGGLIFLENKKKGEAFYELKGAIEIMLNKLGLADVWENNYDEKNIFAGWQKILDSGKTARIMANKRLIGWLGGVKEEICQEPGAGGQAAIFEINLDDLIKLADEEKEYAPPSKFPAITRDLAILADEGIKVEQALNIIENAGGDLLRDADIFDIYENSDGAKSLAFHLVFQSHEKNLTDAEVNKLMEKIIKAIEDKGWEVKK